MARRAQTGTQTGTKAGAKARLLLVGAGHAHLEVLRRLILAPRPDVALTVVSLGPRHHYSGMVPGFLAGAYREEEIAFDLAPLVARAGGVFLQERAVGIDPAARQVHLQKSASLPYDLVSFNVGSQALGQGLPAVRQHAAAVKPMSRAVELARALSRLAGNGVGSAGKNGGPGSPAAAAGAAAVAVVGAGAAGFEVACAAAAALRRGGRAFRVTLIDAGDVILPGYSARFRERGQAVLGALGIEVRTRAPVATVGADFVELAGGERIRGDLTVWVTGAAAPPLFQGSGLPLDPAGFLLVNPALRSPADPRVFAVGDCGTLADHPDTPKAGVYAVRQGPVLWESLIAALEEREPPRYEPQGSFLSILNTGDGKALLRYKGIVSRSRWAWWLKDWIDRRFMEKYQRLGSAPL